MKNENITITLLLPTFNEIDGFRNIFPKVNKELFDFARVGPLKPGETIVVQLGVPASVVSVVDKNGVQTLMPGAYKVEFGVEGAAEGTPAEAELVLKGEAQEMFSIQKIRNARKQIHF